MSAITLPDWRKGYDDRPAKFSCDKDAPFEPDQKAQSDCATTANGRSREAKEPRVRLRVSAVGFLAALVLMLAASRIAPSTPFGGYCENRKGRRGAFCRFSKARSEAELSLPKLYCSKKAKLYPPRPSLRIASMP